MNLMARGKVARKQLKVTRVARELRLGTVRSIDYQIEEFDPGSARTLAAWLRHASRTVNGPFGDLVSGERASNAFLRTPRSGIAQGNLV